jgi:regulator of sigma D
MSVNSYKINLSELGSLTGSTINIPINMNFQLVDQSEIVEKKFVNEEIKKNINQILNYDKIKFKPIIETNSLITLVGDITYKLHFLNTNNTFNSDSYFGDIGFDNFDVKFRKNAFTKSFLRLSFYDSDITLGQRLLSFITLYPKINATDYSPGPNPQWGSITPVNNLKLQFTCSNNLIDRSLNGEGFFIYDYLEDVNINAPKELYMRAEFNNAKDGKTTQMMSTSNTFNSIDNLFKTTNGTNDTNNLFTRYILKKVNGQYYYVIDTNYSNNVQIINNKYVVNLYQIIVI